MTAERMPEETTVSDRGTVPIPSAVRRHLDIGPGDKLRWHVGDEGNLRLEVVRQREGVFDDFEPVDAGETNAVAVEREFGTD